MKIEKLTYAHIDELSQNRVIVDHVDFNLKRGEQNYKSRLYPITGGVYDARFFGSVYKDTCNCGRTTTLNKVCQFCNCEVLSEADKFKRFARINIDMPYVMATKVIALIEFLNKLPINLDEVKEDLGFQRLSKGSVFQVCELCQFNYDEESGIITPTVHVTEESKCSYEGLELIIRNHFHDHLTEYLSIINRRVLVAPAAYRMVSFNPYEYRTKIKIPNLTSIYQAIIYLNNNLRDVLINEESIYDRIAIKACFRRMLSKVPLEVSEILAPSKENIARATYSTNVGDSGRAVITGDPELKLDEIKLPKGAAYELLKVDFIKHLSTDHNMDVGQAEIVYSRASDDTLKLFEKYASTRRILLNRPPTLHRYNMMTYKLLLTDDHTIHFPITGVSPFAADFDGDAMMYTLVPEDYQEVFEKNTSPKNLIRYESTDDFIFKPSHEMIYGLTQCTKIDTTKVLEGKKYFAVEDIITDYDNQVIQFPLDVILLQDKPTTYAYEKLCIILGKDVFELLGSVHPITMKNVSIVLTYINQFEERTTMYRDVIQHALEVLTIEGRTVPGLKDLITKDFSGDIKEFEEVIKLADKDPKYLLKVDEMYKNFVQREVKALNPDLRARIEESNRMKITQLSQMFTPLLFVTKEGKYSIASNSLAQGLSEKDLRKHAFDNRNLLHKKQELTPKGGWLSRQIKFPSQSMKLDRSKLDESNTGIFLPKNQAEGRTTTDGKLLGKSSSKELVRVRSVAMTDLTYFTPDMISEVYHKYEDGSNLGLRLGSAGAGDVTQSGLSLKHTGVIYQLNEDTKLKAPYDCAVSRIDPTTIAIVDIISGKMIKHPVPSNFLISDDKVKKGQYIGFIPEFITPDAQSNMLIDFLGAKSTSDISTPRNPDTCINLAPWKGVVSYKGNTLMIGSHRLNLNPDKLYQVFEGQRVEVGDTLCSGVLDLKVLSRYTMSPQEYYNLFSIQLSRLMPQFISLMYEFFFNRTHKRTDKGAFEFVGIINKVDEASFLTKLSYGGATKLVLGALAQPEVVDSTEDLFTSFFLNLLNSRENND